MHRDVVRAEIFHKLSMCIFKTGTSEDVMTEMNNNVAIDAPMEHVHMGFIAAKQWIKKQEDIAVDGLRQKRLANTTPAENNQSEPTIGAGIL